MTEVKFDQDGKEPLRIDLKSPYLAAALAWLWPGAGHLYQGRYAKGLMFMVCILGTFLFGLGIGHGRVVYATLKPEGSSYRWHYLVQMHVGLPAFPALIQNLKTRNGGDPFFVLCERFPGDYGAGNQGERLAVKSRLRFRRIDDQNRDPNFKGRSLKDGFMAPPAGQITDEENDVLGQWHYELKHLFDMGTYYTMIAGLLNLLVVYDAFVGPAIYKAQKNDPRKVGV